MPYAVSALTMSQRPLKTAPPSGTDNGPRPSLCLSRFLLRSLPLYIALAFALLAGCSTANTRYVEEYEIKQLKVVFLDERSLQERWTQVAGRDPVRFTTPMSSTSPVVKTVRGFYDYTSNTLYCEKWNFEVCGHELHHAALGQFHPQH